MVKSPASTLPRPPSLLVKKMHSRCKMDCGRKTLRKILFKALFFISWSHLIQVHGALFLSGYRKENKGHDEEME